MAVPDLQPVRVKRMGYFLNAFSNITVMPTVRIDHRADATRGGPIWPDWENRSAERHCRNNKPMDKRPVEQAARSVFDLGHAFWGGLVDQHFGHQIADFSMRLIPTRFIDPEARLVFSAGAQPVPPWFLDILAWCNVGPQSLFVVREPTLLRELRVTGQAEQLWGAHPPSEEHLDVMDRFMAAKPQPGATGSRIVYVSRAGLPAARARFAGERCIEHCVEEAGGVVFRPETATIAEQMTVYRTAGRLIFSQGSALHLLQLAGRGFADVFVLQSRPGASNFLPFLQPRCRSVRMLDVSPQMISGINHFGEREDASALAIPQPGPLVRAFREAGLDIAGSFQEQAFRKNAHEDVVQWVRATLSVPRHANWQKSYLSVAQGLREAGYHGLAERVVEVTAKVVQHLERTAG